MRSLKWSTSHAVFVTDMDDEHKEIFEALSELRTALSGQASLLETLRLAQALSMRIVDHFAHEERLMRAARYDSLRWHKQRHDDAVKRAGRFVARMERGDAAAGLELAEYLTSWIPDHTRVADMMLAAFLRNHERGLWKITFSAGTKPADACEWVDANGDKFDPANR